MVKHDVDESSRTAAKPGQAESGQIGAIIELVKDYARQETVGPLRGAGRWLAFGLLGAILLGLGATLLVLGVLRLIQNELAPTFSGRWMSLLPYVIALGMALVVIGLAISRIAKSSLHPGADR